jgi:hypothetical protein
MIIYCSKKLEAFLGPITSITHQTESSKFGDWNGHFFSISRKNCLIFMNNKTCYSVVMTNVLKKDIKDFGQVFRERLIRQLDHDLELDEAQEIKIREDCSNILLNRSNNDKKIIGSINQQVDNLKYNNYGAGIENWNDIEVTGILNRHLLGTKIAANSKAGGDFFRPIDLITELVK